MKSAKILKCLFIILTVLSAISFAGQTGNEDKPLRGKWDFQMKKAWEIEKAGKDIIGSVQNFAAAKDGRVYILDPQNYKIFIMGKDGTFISAFGKRGEGPGEIRNFRNGRQLFAVNNDIIYCDRGRLHYFTLDGKYKKSLIYPAQLKPRTFVSETTFVSAPVSMASAGNREGEIKLYSVTDKSEKILFKFKPFDKATASREGGSGRISVGIIIEDITPLMLVKYRNGKVYFGKNDSYLLNIVDVEGKKTGSFTIKDRMRKDVSRAYKNNLKKQLGDVPPDMVDKIIDSLPEKASFFQQIVVDKNGLVYLAVSDPDNTSLRAIDIFSPQGKYLYSSQFKADEGFDIQVVYFRDDTLLMAMDDEDGNFKVVKYQLKLPTL